MQNRNRPIKQKMPWTKQEDSLLNHLVLQYGTVNWQQISHEMISRNSKQCRERWTNVLNPEILTNEWTEEEDTIIMKFSKLYGNQWAKISKILAGRSPNAIKNRHRSLKRKMDAQMEISANLFIPMIITIPSSRVINETNQCDILLTNDEYIIPVHK